MPTAPNEQNQPTEEQNKARAHNIHEYGKLRAKVLQNLKTIAKNVGLANKEIHRGKATPDRNPRKTGNRLEDLAAACLAYGLNLDFKNTAIMYDRLVPPIELVQARIKSASGKEGLLYRGHKNNFGAGANDLSIQAEKLAKELVSRSGFIGVGGQVVSAQDTQPAALAKTLFSLLKREYDYIIKVQHEEHRISLYANYMNKLRSAGGMLINLNDPRQSTKNRKFFPQPEKDPKKQTDQTAPTPDYFTAVDEASQLVTNSLPVGYQVSQTAEEAQEVAKQRAKAIAEYGAARNNLGNIYRSTLATLLKSVIQKRQEFIKNFEDNILEKYFNEVWPESYDDYLAMAKKHNHYTSEAALPHTLKTLERGLKVTATHETTGYTVFKDIMKYVNEGLATLSGLANNEIEPGEDDDNIVKAQKKSARGALFDAVEDALVEVNNGIIHYKLSFNPQLPKVESNIPISSLVGQINEQLFNFMLKVGGEVIPKLYNTDKIKADDMQELGDKLQQPPFDQKLPSTGLSGLKIVYKFSFDDAGQVSPTSSSDFLSYVKEGGAAQPSKGQLSMIQPTAKANWPRPVFETDDTGASPSPDDDVVFTFYTLDSTYNKRVPAAVELKRGELYARHQDLFSTSITQSLDGKVIVNVTENETNLIKNSDNLLAAHLATFNRLIKLKGDPQPLVVEIGKALRSGVDFDSKGYPIKLVMPEGTGKIEDPTKIANYVVSEYFKLLNPHDGSSTAKIGSFPRMQFDFTDPDNPVISSMDVPVFFTTSESHLNITSECPEALQSYEALQEQHPWPEYAQAGDSYDPDIILRVKYSLNGEDKTEDISAKDIYARGLDSEAGRQKAGITSWSYDSASPEPESKEEFIFYTDESAHLSGVPKIDCQYCKKPHYEYTKQLTWNSVLDSFGRNPAEQVLVKWTDNTKTARESVVRRHELYERNTEIKSGIGDYQTQPISQTKGLGVYAINPNQELKTIYGPDYGLGIIDKEQYDGFIDTINAMATTKGDQLYGWSTPKTANESVDRTDSNIAEQLSRVMSYYDPLMASMRSITTKEQDAGKALMDTFIHGDNRSLTTMRAQVNSPDDPSAVWYMDDKVTKSRQIEVKGNDLYIVFPKMSQAFFDDKSIVVPKGFDPEDRKFLVYQHPVHKQWVVDVPWVQSMGDAKVSTDTSNNAQFVCKTPRCPKDPESGGNEIIDSIIIPMPLSSPSDVSIVLSQGGDHIKLKQGELVDGVATGHYQLVGDHFRQIKWLGSYEDPVQKSQITLSHNDTFIMTFNTNYKSATKKLAYETLPVQRALEIAAGLWYNHNFNNQPSSTKWRFTRDELTPKRMDENGQVFVEIEMKGGRARNVSLLTALRLYARKSELARDFLAKLGKRLCSNWIRNEKEHAVTPCPGIAEHIDMPQELYMTSKMQLGQGRPKWILATREISQAKLNAKMIDSIGGRPEDAQYFEKRATELENQYLVNKTARQKGALELDGGLCTPCWMSWYEIIPDNIVAKMWNDLEELRALSAKFCGTKTSGRGKNKTHIQKGTGGQRASRNQWFIKLVDNTKLDQVHFTKAPSEGNQFYTVRDSKGTETSFKREDIMWANKTGYDHGLEIVYGDLQEITYKVGGEERIIIGTDEGMSEDGKMIVMGMNGQFEFIENPQKTIIGVKEFSQEKGKQVILDKLEDFYVNYLSDQSFWPVVRDYLREEIKSKEGKKAAGMADRRNKMANQLVELHKSIHEKFMILIDPGDGSTPLIDLGMDDGESPIQTVGRTNDQRGEQRQTLDRKKKATFMPWFTRGVIELMHMINGLKMWTILVKARYSRRELAATSSDNIVSMMSLTRKDVRDRQHLSMAMQDAGSRPKYGASPFKWLSSVQKEGIDISQYGRIIIDNVVTDKYLNGLTGIIESVIGSNCVIKLDRNDILTEERILVSRDEFSLMSQIGKLQIPLKPKSARPVAKPAYRQQHVNELQDKIDYIKVIGDFTSEHPWS